MAGKTYNNQLRQHEVSIAVEKFLIAAYPTTFTLARVDINSPPAGFFDLGAVVEDSPSIRYGRSVYKIETGIPRTVQYEQVVAVSGVVEFAIWSNTFFQAQFALGNASSITTITTIASGSSVTQYLGTGVLKEYTLLGVADFLNGSQVIHEFPRVAPSADFAEAFRPGDAARIPLAFECKSTIATLGTCEHLIVGKRHYFGPDGSVCST